MFGHRGNLDRIFLKKGEKQSNSDIRKMDEVSHHPNDSIVPCVEIL
jgi:hypothetical protein